MNGLVLPVIPIGNKNVNLVNICYWQELEDGSIEIVYPGPTVCRLTVEESEQFRQKMAPGRSALVAPPPGPADIWR